MCHDIGNNETHCVVIQRRKKFSRKSDEELVSFNRQLDPTNELFITVVISNCVR